MPRKVAAVKFLYTGNLEGVILEVLIFFTPFVHGPIFVCRQREYLKIQGTDFVGIK